MKNIKIKFLTFLVILSFVFIFKEANANSLDIKVYVKKSFISGVNNNKIHLGFKSVFNCLINSNQFRNQFYSLGIRNNFNELYQKQGIKNINFHIRKILLEYFRDNNFIIDQAIDFTCHDSDSYVVKSDYDVRGRTLERISILLIPTMLVKQFPKIKIPLHGRWNSSEPTMYHKPWEESLKKNFYNLFTIKFSDLKNKHNNLQKKRDTIDYKKIHQALYSGQLNDDLYTQGLFINFTPGNVYELNYCFLQTDDFLKLHAVVGYINFKEEVLFQETKISLIRERESLTGKVPYGFFSKEKFNNPIIKAIKNLDIIASKVDHLYRDCNIFVGRNSDIKKLRDFMFNSNKNRGYHKISWFHGRPIENKILLDHYSKTRGFNNYHQFTLNRIFGYSVEELKILQQYKIYNILDLKAFANKSNQVINFNKGIKISTDFIESYFNSNFKTNKNLDQERKEYLEKILSK